MATLMVIIYFIGYIAYVTIGSALVSETEEPLLGFIVVLATGVFWFGLLPLILMEERK